MGERYTDWPAEGSDGACAPLAAVREVRRYPNRRLYDVTTRAYVGLDAVDAWITAGQSVRVIDVKTGGDVTVMVLAPLAAEKLQTRMLARADGAEEIQRWIRGVDERAPAAASNSDPSQEAENTSLDERLTRIEARLTALERGRRQE
jgi:hypothetical protein